MNQPVTQGQRQQAAHQWRQFAPTQGLSLAQTEAFAQRILSGEIDGQVADYIARSRQQRPPRPPGFGFQGAAMPSYMPVPPMPWMLDPSQFTPPFMQPMGPMASFPPAPPMAAMHVPPMPLSPMHMPPMHMPPMHMSPMPLHMGPPHQPPHPFPLAPSLPIPYHNIAFAGGAVNTRNVYGSSRNGNDTFTYSNSSTSANWSGSEGAANATNLFASDRQGAQRHTGDQRSAAQTIEWTIEELPPSPDSSNPNEQEASAKMGSQVSTPTSSTSTDTPQDSSPRPPAQPPKPKTPASSPGRRTPSIRQAVPGIAPLEGTNSSPQNPRLHRAFERQLNDGVPEEWSEETESYFSDPPGALDEEVEKGGKGEVEQKMRRMGMVRRGARDRVL